VTEGIWDVLLAAVQKKKTFSLPSLVEHGANMFGSAWIELKDIVTYLINTLPGSSSVNMVHYVTVEVAVFSACPFGARAVMSAAVL
jgi:hypothetical protein